MDLSDWLSFAAIIVSIGTFALFFLESKRKPSFDVFAMTEFKEISNGYQTFAEVILCNKSSNTISINYVVMNINNEWFSIASLYPALISVNSESNPIYSDALPINIPAKESKYAVLEFWYTNSPDFSKNEIFSATFKVISSNGKKCHEIKNIRSLMFADCADFANKQSLRKRFGL